MKLTITKDSHNNFCVFLDGTESVKYQVSRTLTETTSETEDGIFEQGEVTFWRRDMYVTCNFETDYREALNPALELKQRAELVLRLFDDKYGTQWSVDI